MKSIFFNQDIQGAPIRVQTAHDYHYLLDKNEQSIDVDRSIKQKLYDSLQTKEWNRYPGQNLQSLEEKVAHYCGLEAKHIVLSSGSANLITTLLNYFGLQRKHIVITQPSYSLFDYHCKTYQINYEPCFLEDDLTFNLDLMPTLNDQSVVFITSPNNPTGNAISKAQLHTLLTCFPESLFIADAVYTEFANDDFTPLVLEFENLMVIRSFSKAFPIAGLRLGYLCAPPALASVVKKLVLQFSLNLFTITFAEELLFSHDFLEDSKQRISEIVKERERMISSLENLLQPTLLKVYPSQGNFILIRIGNNILFNQVKQEFNKKSIRILDTSSNYLLEHTLRISIGSNEENNLVLSSIKKVLLTYKNQSLIAQNSEQYALQVA